MKKIFCGTLKMGGEEGILAWEGDTLATTFDGVKGVLVEKLRIEEGKITEEASFEKDLKLDSLDQIELIMKLQDEFGMEISDDDARTLLTVGEAVKYIERRLAEATAGV